MKKFLLVIVLLCTSLFAFACKPDNGLKEGNGVIKMLRDAGVEEGDTVNIYDFEFDFVY